jgi:hypothetical protein
LDKAHLINRLNQSCCTAGGVSPWAKANAFTRQFVAAVLRGDEEPTERLANALGCFRLVVFLPFDQVRTRQEVAEDRP